MSESKFSTSPQMQYFSISSISNIPSKCPLIFPAYVMSTSKMAARMSAAAFGSPVRCLCFMYVLLCMLICAKFCQAKQVYSRQELINIGLQSRMAITADFQRANSIPADIAKPPGSTWIVIGCVKQRRRRKERKQKRGCRAGLLARLRKQPYKPPLPSLFLSNARSITHKMDDMELLIANNNSLRDCCVIYNN